MFNILSFTSIYMGRISLFEVGSLKRYDNISTFYNKIFYLIGVDSILNYSNNSFIIYQGFFKTNSFLYNKANLIFPISTYMERYSTYLNIEGRIRLTKKAITSFKFVLTDLEIFKGCFLLYRKKFVYNFSIIYKFHFILNFFNYFINYFSSFIFNVKSVSIYLKTISGFFLNRYLRYHLRLLVPVSILYFKIININIGYYINTLLNKVVHNYYAMDLFSKNSRIMALCALRTFSVSFSNHI